VFSKKLLTELGQLVTPRSVKCQHIVCILCTSCTKSPPYNYRTVCSQYSTAQSRHRHQRTINAAEIVASITGNLCPHH